MKGREAWLAVAVVFLIWALGLTAVQTLVPVPKQGASAPLMAVFPPSLTGDGALRAIVLSGARPLRPVLGENVWLLQDDDGTASAALHANGAWFVMAPPLGIAPAGCAGLGLGPKRKLPEAMGQ